jgi:mersacidin/lichenicidin family type 2 lantibiotic
MAHKDIIRAWKDEEYRRSLTDAERAQLPAHPAGLIELDDADLGLVAGGLLASTHSTVTSVDICCCSGCAC